MITRDNYGRIIEDVSVDTMSFTSASTWTVPHYRGRPVIYQVLDENNRPVLVDVDQTNPNVAVATFEYAATGKFVFK